MTHNPDNRQRTRLLQLRLSQEEHEKLDQLVKASSNKSKSALIRSWIQKGVPASPQSVDPSLIRSLSELKGELNKIGRNFNQAVKGLHLANKREEYIPSNLIVYLNSINTHLEILAEQIQSLVKSYGHRQD